MYKGVKKSAPGSTAANLCYRLCLVHRPWRALCLCHGQLARTNREYEANTAAIDEARRNLELKEQILEESNRQLFENTNTESVRFKPATFKYITQSDLYDGNTRFSKEFESDQTSMQFDYRSVNDSLASSGADTNDDPGTAMLGALEINLNATGELVEQRLNIRGDPYWLGKPKGAAATNDNQADYEFGGLGYFFNMKYVNFSIKRGLFFLNNNKVRNSSFFLKNYSIMQLSFFIKFKRYLNAYQIKENKVKLLKNQNFRVKNLNKKIKNLKKLKLVQYFLVKKKIIRRVLK